MDADFWHERWENQQIGFHQEDVNSHLQNYWGNLELESGHTVFVPLCGKSKDMLWLALHGFKVIGVELSAIASEAFFKENSLDYEKTHESKFTRYHSENITIYQGNFFDLGEEQVGQCDATFDRASLIALPMDMRLSYIKQMKKFPKLSSNQLLVTLNYDQSRISGPPFSVTQKDVNHYYSDTHDVDVIYELDVIDEMKNFQKAGITEIVERVYHLKSKQNL